jgi:hypothetical protein
VELRPGEVNRAQLSHCQALAEDGQFAAAMGGYLTWIARDYEQVQDRLRRRSRELRGDMIRTGEPFVHARLPGILSDLQSGWEMWLQFALEVGAINGAEKARCMT